MPLLHQGVREAELGEDADSVPLRAADVFTQMLPLRVLETTFSLRPMPMSLVWHERTHEDPGAKYFRDLVVRAVLGGARREPRRVHLAS